jgi:uncharacterized OB-fold protein
MVRSIRAGAIVRPAGRLGGVAVEGPDEDGFTLAVDALEALPKAGPGPVGCLHLVGEHPPGVETLLPTALGAPVGTVVRYPGSVAALWEAIRAAQSPPPGSPSDLVVAVDIAGRPVAEEEPRWESAAGALRIADGVGAVLLPHGHPEEGSSSEAAQTGSERAEPVGRPPTAPLADAAEGPAVPILRTLQRACGSGSPGRVVRIPDAALGSAGDAAIRVDLPVPWGERGPARERPVTLEEWRRRLRRGTGQLSEGAYLPRPTYLESRPSRWRLSAEECPACGALTFPARGRCGSCGHSEGLKRLELARSGLLVEATTVVHPGAQPTEFDPMVEDLGAYEVVIARAAPQVRVTLQLADGAAGTVRIGDRVDTRLRRLFAMEGEWRYGLKAVPGSPPSAGAEAVAEPPAVADGGRRPAGTAGQG